MLKTLKNKKAEGYIDVAVAVLVIALVLVLIISIWSMVTLKQDMTYMCTVTIPPMNMVLTLKLPSMRDMISREER